MLRKVLLCAVLLMSPVWADTATFVVHDPAGRDDLDWVGKAHGETVKGSTSKVWGSLTGNPQDIANNPQIDVEADLGSMTTGNKSRDATMRGSGCLNVAQFPTVKWVLKKVTQSSAKALASGTPIELDATGDLTLHGVTKEVPVHATITWNKAGTIEHGVPGDVMHVVGTIDINMTDFGIAQPQFLFFKMENGLQITLDFYGATGLKP